MICPEFMTTSQAMAMLSVRSPKTLRKLRLDDPKMAVVLPGMKQWRYVRSRLLQKVAERKEHNGSD